MDALVLQNEEKVRKHLIITSFILRIEKTYLISGQIPGNHSLFIFVRIGGLRVQLVD